MYVISTLGRLFKIGIQADKPSIIGNDSFFASSRLPRFYCIKSFLEHLKTFLVWFSSYS